jgi:hypothetical protein
LPRLLQYEEGLASDASHLGEKHGFIRVSENMFLTEHEERQCPMDRSCRIKELNPKHWSLGVIDHEWVVTRQLIFIPTLSRRLQKEFDDETGEEFSFRDVWIPLQVGAVCLAPDHHFVGKHLATTSDERCQRILHTERDGDTARFEKPEYVTGCLRCQRSFTFEHIMLVTIASCDVILGGEYHQIRLSFDAKDLFCLTFGQLRAERILVSQTIGSLPVHSQSPFLGFGLSEITAWRYRNSFQKKWEVTKGVSY